MPSLNINIPGITAPLPANSGICTYNPQSGMLVGSALLYNDKDYLTYLHTWIPVQVNGNARANTRIAKPSVGLAKITAWCTDGPLQVTVPGTPGQPTQMLSVIVDTQVRIGVAYQGTNLQTTGPGQMSYPSLQPWAFAGYQCEGPAQMLVAVQVTPHAHVQFDWAFDVAD